MARSRSLTNLLLDVRQRTNQENSTFVTDAELTEYLNQEIAELEVKLNLAQGQPHFRSETSISVVSPTALYALPADFWAVQEVTATVSGITSPLRPFMASEHAILTNTSVFAPYFPVSYRIQASNIEFRPATQSFTATLYYSPTQTRLSTGSDTWDGFDGYEMAAIYGACAQVMAKEESDPSFFMAQRERVYQTITQAAANRDMSNPERVQDVSGDGFTGPYGFLRWP